MPEWYFQTRKADNIVDDLNLVHRFMRQLISEQDRALAPVTSWRDEPERGHNTVKICTWDRSGLFSKIAGTLSATGLNILSARIFTRADGIALDSFFVNDARTGNLATREQHDEFAELLKRILLGESVDLSALIAHRITNRPAYQAYVGEQMPTQIHFDNEVFDSRTLIEIQTEDRLGLLYAISQTFTELSLDITGARIVTERGAAIDSFYVREIDGGKVELTERRRLIERGLRQGIQRLGTATAS